MGGNTIASRHGIRGGRGEGRGRGGGGSGGLDDADRARRTQRPSQPTRPALTKERDAIHALRNGNVSLSQLSQSSFFDRPGSATPGPLGQGGPQRADAPSAHAGLVAGRDAASDAASDAGPRSIGKGAARGLARASTTACGAVTSVAPKAIVDAPPRPALEGERFDAEPWMRDVRSRFAARRIVSSDRRLRTAMPSPPPKEIPRGRGEGERGRSASSTRAAACVCGHHTAAGIADPSACAGEEGAYRRLPLAPAHAPVESVRLVRCVRGEGRGRRITPARNPHGGAQPSALG